MARKYSNHHGISLPLAVWLARDEYEYDDRTNVISATSLLKSVRQIVLSSRIQPTEGNIEDISTRLASRIGTALHNSVEHAWTESYGAALSDLGYPQHAIDRVAINPTAPQAGDIPVYFEQRSEKQVGKWIVSGQFDIVFDGAVNDVKSTSVYTWINNTNDDKYKKQLSIYRWLNPEIITKPHGAIQFIFKDWNKNMAHGKDKKYPKLPVMEYKLQLDEPQVTEMWVNEKLNQIDKYLQAPESELPLCTPDDLWQSEPVYKYYANPSAKRATKVFNNLGEARRFLMVDKKGKGEVREIRGEPTACRFCPAAGICSQFKRFVQNGDLKV